jgi:hypothetical protein
MRLAAIRALGRYPFVSGFVVLFILTIVFLFLRYDVRLLAFDVGCTIVGVTS